MAISPRVRAALLPFVFALLIATASSTGGGCSSASASCVDFTIGTADVSCNASSDCSSVGPLHLCPQDVACAFQNAVNQSGAARYQAATASVPLNTTASCGAPFPVACVAGRCVVSR